MVLGVAVGAGIALLFRRGPKGKRPVAAVVRAAGAGARQAGRYGRMGARWAAERGEALKDSLPTEEIGEAIGQYLASARDTIEDVVEQELKDLRKAIRRQRKRLGV
jgi:hypothetical protein